MQRQLDKWTTAFSAALVIAALLACKKKKEEPPAANKPPAATAPAAAATPAPTATQEPTSAASPKLGDVKRFADKEKEATGAVKVLENDVKVFNEPDEKTEEVATLSKDIFVFRLATIDDKWVLVEFPSGVGKVSPGWVEAKFLESKVEAVARDTVAKQAKSATIKPAASVAAVPSAAPSSSVKPVASVAASVPAKPASSAPKPAASVAPKPTGTAPAKRPPPVASVKK